MRGPHGVDEPAFLGDVAVPERVDVVGAVARRRGEEPEGGLGGGEHGIRCGQPHFVDDRVEVDDAARDRPQMRIVAVQCLVEVDVGEGGSVQFEQMVVDRVRGVEEPYVQGTVGRA